jgi:hypothetical protein
MWKEEYPRLLGDKAFILAALNKVSRCQVRFTPIFKTVMALPLHGCVHFYTYICNVCKYELCSLDGL